MLTDAQREVATRKLAEAKAAMAARAAGSLIATQEGCMPRPCVTLAHPHLVTLVPTLTLTQPQPEPEPEPEAQMPAGSAEATAATLQAALVAIASALSRGEGTISFNEGLQSLV